MLIKSSFFFYPPARTIQNLRKDSIRLFLFLWEDDGRREECRVQSPINHPQLPPLPSFRWRWAWDQNLYSGYWLISAGYPIPLKNQTHTRWIFIRHPPEELWILFPDSNIYSFNVFVDWNIDWTLIQILWGKILR